MARRANSLTTLVNQINQLYPNRNKASCGWLGDAAHQATKSQHNPNSSGVVTAQDITHDPHNGLDAGKLAEYLIKDSRTWYVIFNRRIWEGSWKAYNGSNAHTKHVHISVKQSSGVYDDSKQWNLGKEDEVITVDWETAWKMADANWGWGVRNTERKNILERDIVGKEVNERFNFMYNHKFGVDHRLYLDKLEADKNAGFEPVTEPLFKKK